MPRIKISFAGSPGVLNDPYEQDVPPNAFSRVQNARFGEKGAQSFPGHTEIFPTEDGSAGLVTATWIKYFPDRTAPRWVYANNNQVFVYEDFDYENITRFTSSPGDNDYNATERWQGTLFNGIGILNNGFDIPQVWLPIDSTQELVDMSDWPTGYRARFVKPFKEFLIAGHIFDGTDLLPNRIIWSNRANPGQIPPDWDFADPTSDAGERDLQKASAIIDGLDLAEQFIIYREGATWALQLSGDNNIMRTYEISDSTGILWKDCVASVPKVGHVVATWDDVVVHKGSSASFQSVLDPGRRRWIGKTLNQDKYKESFIVLNHPEKEVWFCFPQTGYDYANIAMVWNWQNGKCGERDLPSVPFADAGPIVLEE